jgi:hypothetical protein
MQVATPARVGYQAMRGVGDVSIEAVVTVTSDGEGDRELKGDSDVVGWWQRAS